MFPRPLDVLGLTPQATVHLGNRKTETAEDEASPELSELELLGIFCLLRLLNLFDFVLFCLLVFFLSSLLHC